MDNNIQTLKNAVIDNDFYLNDNDKRRIYDLETFYQKKYNNNTDNKYNNIYNKNNNYQILENNINNYQIKDEIFENKNNNIENENKKLSEIFANDIEAENNIGKYKEKIINRSHIVEENYKKFNEYQNNKFKRVNLRYNNNQNKDINNKGENSNENTPLIINKNNYYYRKRNTPNQSMNFLNKGNNNNIVTNRVGNRMYKSQSSGNIFQNNFYLSNSNFEQGKNSGLNNNINHNSHFNEYMGKRKTDITNNELINIRGNNGFYDYCNKQVEIFLDNQRMMEEKKNREKISKYNSRIQEQNEINLRNNFFNNLNAQNLLELKNSKIKYKNVLDEQVQNNINNKLFNENLTLGDVVLNKFYLKNKSNAPNSDFLNKNRFVEVNPYNHRNYYLGNSSLSNNVILNPQDQYKSNRYIFPQIPSNK